MNPPQVIYFVASPFVQGCSLIHRLDPRLRIVIASLFSLMVAISVQLSTLLLALAYSLTLVLLVHPPVYALFQRLITLNLFTGLLFLLLLFPEKQMSLEQVILLSLKSNTILFLLTMLISTIEPMTLAHALHHLRIPNKLIYLLLFTLRYLEILHREYKKLLQAMSMRGFQPRFNWHTYRSFAYLIGMLLVKSLDRSERILAAMKCRGFQGKFFLFDHFSLHQRDYLFSSGSLIFLWGMVTIEWFSLWLN